VANLKRPPLTENDGKQVAAKKKIDLLLSEVTDRDALRFSSKSGRQLVK
jgi:hypothetical protein